MGVRWLVNICAALCTAGAAFAAEDLTCKLQELTNTAGYGSDVEITISPGTPQIPKGSFLTGVHCVFDKLGGNPITDHDRDRREGYLSTSDGPGYRCFVAPNGTSYYRVTLQAVVCSLTSKPEEMPQPIRRAPFSNDGLGGATVVIAIDGREAEAPLPVDYLLCNTTGGAALSADYAPGKTRPVPFGSCIETSRPAGLAIRTPDTVVVNESGFYRAFPRGTIDKTKVKRLHKFNEEKFDQNNLPTRVSVGAFEAHTAQCVAGQQPGGPILNKDWPGYCPLDEIKAGANYRLCFTKGFTSQGEGKLEYPGGLLPLVLNRTLMEKPRPENYVGLKYQAITYGCRDIFNANEAYVLISINDWIGQKVGRIVYSLAEIKILH